MIDWLVTVLMWCRSVKTNNLWRYVRLPHSCQQFFEMKPVFQCLPLTFVWSYLRYTFENFLKNEACDFEQSSMPSKNDSYNFIKIKCDSKVNYQMATKIRSMTSILIMYWLNYCISRIKKNVYHVVNLNCSKNQSKNTTYDFEQSIYDRNGDKETNIMIRWFLIMLIYSNNEVNVIIQKSFPYLTVFCAK